MSKSALNIFLNYLALFHKHLKVLNMDEDLTTLEGKLKTLGPNNTLRLNNLYNFLPLFTKDRW